MLLILLLLLSIHQPLAPHWLTPFVILKMAISGTGEMAVAMAIATAITVASHTALE